MVRRLPAFEDADAKKTLDKLCQRHGVPTTLVHQMAEILARHTGSAYKAGISAELDMLLNESLRESEESE